MGIDLYCGDKTFGCSYGTWYNVRTALIEATFKYLEVHFALSEYEEGTEEHGAITALNQYIEKINSRVIIKESVFGKENNLFDEFYSYLRLHDFIDLLIRFDVGGIYALCNKSDSEGFYSVGNSYDICDLLKIVKPFLLKNKDEPDSEENWLYKWIDEITIVFKESIDKQLIVEIR